MSVVTTTAVERGLLLAVLYADLFEYPLTPLELHAQLVAVRATPTELERALEGLLARGALARAGEYVVWPGRESLAGLRHERQRLSAALWPRAERFARLLQRAPFVRLVAVCGSLARENAGPGADIDLFVVTAPGRLWLVHVAAMALRRLMTLGGAELCPNHFVTTETLAAELRTLYTAHEVVQVVPLSGGDVYRQFVEANRWTRHFLPQADGAERATRAPQRPPGHLTLWLERCLGGWLGEAVDRLLHRVLVRYYAWRLRPLGLDRDAVLRSYRRDAQRVVTGGYAPAVAQRFREQAAARLAGIVNAAEVEALFPARGMGPADAPHELYRRLLAESYGGE